MKFEARFAEKNNKWASALFGIIILLITGYIGMENFLLFHFFAEGFTIVVGTDIA